MGRVLEKIIVIDDEDNDDETSTNSNEVKHSKVQYNSFHLSRDDFMDIKKLDAEMIDNIEDKSEHVKHNSHHHTKNNKHKKRHSIYHRNLKQIYDVDVTKVQNRSVCNYTVEPFDITDDYIKPKDLVEITCNDNVIGSNCQFNGGYCCMQTYSTIQVLNKKGSMKRKRINTGCICALQIFAMANHTDNTDKYLNN